MAKRRSWTIGLGVLALIAGGVAGTVALNNSNGDSDGQESGTDQTAEVDTGQQPLNESTAGVIEGDGTDGADSTDGADGETATNAGSDDSAAPTGDADATIADREQESGDPEELPPVNDGSDWQPILECVNGLIIQADGANWRIEELGMEPQPLENGDVPRQALVELCGAEPTAQDLENQQKAVESLAYELTLLGPITFDAGTTNLSGDSASVLDLVAELLLAQPGALVEIAGHADSRGSQTANLLLSEQRAEAIVSELERRGVLNELVPIGRGEEVLRQINEDDAEALSQNRRIELRVIL